MRRFDADARPVGDERESDPRVVDRTGLVARAPAVDAAVPNATPRGGAHPRFGRLDAAAPAARVAAARRRLAHVSSVVTSTPPSPPRSVVVVGGMVLDVTARPSPGQPLRRGSSTPGRVIQTPGGVGRNLAEGILRVSPPGAAAPLLISAVGDDLAGRALVGAWTDLGGSPDAIRVVADAATPVVAAVLDGDGEVAASVADTVTAERDIDPSWIASHARRIANAAAVVLDGNCSPAALAAAAAATENGARGTDRIRRPPLVWFEPVSVAKSTRAGEAGILSRVDFVSPNVAELRAMAADVRARERAATPSAAAAAPVSSAPDGEYASAWAAANATARDAETLLRAGVGRVVLTLGSLGVLVCERNPDGEGARHLHLPALPATVRSVVGAGDALVAGCVAALSAGRSAEEAVAIGVAAARRAVESDENVGAGGGGTGAEALEADAREVMRGASTVTVTATRGGS
jgi:pseudouridine kinase